MYSARSAGTSRAEGDLLELDFRENTIRLLAEWHDPAMDSYLLLFPLYSSRVFYDWD